MRRLAVNEALDVLAARLADVRDATVVAIDGHSAAGKSTFAAALADRVDGLVVAGDDFYRVMDPARRAALSPAEGADLYYDWPRMRRDVLEPLRLGEAATFRQYDWITNSLDDATITVGPASLTIVEGLFVSRPELEDLVDITVLLEAPAEVRRDRQLTRADSSTSWMERWDAAERWFFHHVRTPDDFDLCVRGSD